MAKRGVRNAAYFAQKAVEDAKSQTTSLPGEKRAASLTSDLAQQILDLDERIKQIDQGIAEVLTQDERSAIIQSLPGMGPLLTAEFIAFAGDLSGYKDAGHLASHAGIAPASRDSGKRTNNNRRPRHYNRRLCRLFYLSAQPALLRPGATGANELRGCFILRRCCAWPGSGSTCCGRCCATSGRTHRNTAPRQPEWRLRRRR
ncbi:hypothetical protein GCM10009603_04020 [Nocardiopsis exhalans]